MLKEFKKFISRGNVVDLAVGVVIGSAFSKIVSSLVENLIKLHGKAPYTDIPIEFSGLRPGEKLFEELLMSEEGLRETANKKIFIGKQIEINEEEFIASIERIREIAYSNNSEKTVEELEKIVPTFNHVVIK